MAEGMPQYSIDQDYPLLCERASAFDFAERLGGSTSGLDAEIDQALRELWDARRNVADRSDACSCLNTCGDAVGEEGVCKGLRRTPEPPLVEVVLVHRGDKK